MTPRPWFIDEPTRLAYEIAELQEIAPVEVDETLKAQGALVARLNVVIRNQAVALEVHYPPAFPYSAPQVGSPQLALDSHQSPYVRGLCLLTAQGAWLPHYSGAQLIREAISLLDASLGDREHLDRDSVEAPEPSSFYYSYHANAGLVIPPEMQDLEQMRGRWGEFEVLVTKDGPALLTDVRFSSPNPPPAVRCAPYLREVWTSLMPQSWRGIWCWSDERPPYNDYADQRMESQYRGFNAHLRKHLPDIDRRLAVSGRADHGRLVAAIYADESGRKGAFIAGWLTLWTRRDKAFRFYRPLYWPDEAHLLGESPLASLRGKSVIVVGAGTLGSTIAVELGKAGVGRLLVLDPDSLSPANLVRHEGEFVDVGQNKALVVGRRVRTHAPWTRVDVAGESVGTADLLDPIGSWQRYARFYERVAESDLVIDATGDPQAGMTLNSMAVRTATPLLIAWATGGAWGGRLIRVRPGGPCYECAGWAIASGSPMPAPPSDESVVRYPQGCAHRSFTGAGFETKTIALAATRMAVATLSAGQGYPDFDVDHIVLAIRDDVGHFERNWIPVEITRQAACTVCGQPQLGQGAA